MQGFSYLYDDFGSKISVNLIGPFAKPTNSNITCDSIFIYSQIGNRVQETRRFDIKRSGNDQTKLDIVCFDIELDIIETMHAQLNLSLQIITHANDGVAFQMSIDAYSLDTAMGAICGGIILILLNVLIISEVKRILDQKINLNFLAAYEFRLGLPQHIYCFQFGR